MKKGFIVILAIIILIISFSFQISSESNTVKQYNDNLEKEVVLLKEKNNLLNEELKTINYDKNILIEENTYLKEELDTQKNVSNQTLIEFQNENEYLRKNLTSKLITNKGTILTTNYNIVKGNEIEKTAYLTFDDGPSKNTIKILDILKKYDAKATFFHCGADSDYAEKIWERILNEGHAIGNHSSGHNYSYLYQSVDNTLSDIKKMNDILYKRTGTTTNIMRFPGGSNNTVSKKYGGTGIMSEITGAVLLEGYQYFDWNVDSLDASEITASKDKIVGAIKNQVGNKDIINVLFHDSSAKTTTVEALPEILEFLKSKGYTFKILTKNSTAHHLY